MSDRELVAILEARAKEMPVGAQLEKAALLIAARALKESRWRPYGRWDDPE